MGDRSLNDSNDEYLQLEYIETFATKALLYPLYRMFRVNIGLVGTAQSK